MFPPDFFNGRESSTLLPSMKFAFWLHIILQETPYSQVFLEKQIEVPIRNPLAVLFSSRTLRVFTVKLDVPPTHGVAEAIVLAARCLTCPLVSWDPRLSLFCTSLPLCVVLHTQCHFSSLPYFNSPWDLPSYGCCCTVVVFVFVFLCPIIS